MKLIRSALIICTMLLTAAISTATASFAAEQNSELPPELTKEQRDVNKVLERMWFVVKDQVEGFLLNMEFSAEVKANKELAKTAPVELFVTKLQVTRMQKYRNNAVRCLRKIEALNQLPNQFDSIVDLFRGIDYEVSRMSGINVCLSIEQFKFRGLGEFDDWNQICANWKEAVARGEADAETVCSEQ